MSARVPVAAPPAAPATPAAPPSLTNGPLARTVWRFGLPMMAAMVLHAAFNMVDVWIVSRIPEVGAEALAGVSSATIANMVVMILANGISVGTLAVAARRCGERRPDLAGLAGDQGFLLLSVLAAVASVPGVVFSEQIVAALGLDPGKPEGRFAHEYNAPMMAGAITMFVLLQTTTLMRAAGDAVWPMVLLIGSNGLNIVLTYWWVFGGLGLPAYGVPGAAWSTIVARGIGAIVGLVLLARGVHGVRFSVAGLRPSRRLAGELLHIGLPQSAQVLVWIGAVWVLNALVARVGGAHAVAAYGVAARLDMFAIYGATGWGAAAATLVGQNLGAGRVERAIRAGWLAAGFGAIAAGVMTAACLIAPERILYTLADNDAVVAIAAGYLWTVAPAWPLFAVAVVLACALNGAGSTKIPFALDTLGRVGVQIPLAFALAASPALGLHGIWIAVVVAAVVLAVGYAAVYRQRFWAVASPTVGEAERLTS